MPEKTEFRVHLDHLLPKQSLRYTENAKEKVKYIRPNDDLASKLPFKDLEEGTDLFPWLHKPDFQRETSAWTPNDCVDLLKSVVNQLIVPGLILWRSQETGLVYILDGSHRVSVVRAWMLDDWGDKAEVDYYERHERNTEIQEAANEVRTLVRQEIGSFEDFKTSGQKYYDASKARDLSSLSEEQIRRGLFYADIKFGAGFHIQWEKGTYEAAEASFLRINKSGQRLDDLEITLIQYRNSSFARATMSVAHGGNGHFWPDERIDENQKTQVEQLSQHAQDLHRKLFVPPLRVTIRDANVPFIVSPGYFQKQAYLLELLPVVSGKNGLPEDIQALFERDKDASASIILNNGLELTNNAVKALTHLTGPDNEPKTLAIVTLFYFYSITGSYVLSSLYGFLSWINSGNDDEIRIRKTIFSAHRGRFEQVIFEQDLAGGLTARLGSGGRATLGTAQFFDGLLGILEKNPSPVSDPSFQNDLDTLLKKFTAPRLRKSASESRVASSTQKITVNIRTMFKYAIRCDICNGALDLRGGIQYDHATDYRQVQITETDNLRTTHPFCNNQKTQIKAHLDGTEKLRIPSFKTEEPEAEAKVTQLSMFNDVFFPDEAN